jgi:hypothetical protein
MLSDSVLEVQKLIGVRHSPSIHVMHLDIYKSKAARMLL